jgi:hypothetical protein
MYDDDDGTSIHYNKQPALEMSLRVTLAYVVQGRKQWKALFAAIDSWFSCAPPGTLLPLPPDECLAERGRRRLKLAFMLFPSLSLCLLNDQHARQCI